MTPSMKHWNDWADPEDMEAMWEHPDVFDEWTAAGEERGRKVHMLRNPDGQSYVTQTEMRAIAEIITIRHFRGKLDPAMICAIAEIESDRQPLAYRYEHKLGEASTGLMQTLQSTADWLARDMGYKAYSVDWTSTMLYRPFVSVYFGAAYLNWLSTYNGKQRSDEFIVRGYNAGPKKTGGKLTERYWKNYMAAKQMLPKKSSVAQVKIQEIKLNPTVSTVENRIVSADKNWTYWDEKASPEDMEEMWRHPDVAKEWLQTGERKGKVRFSRDCQMRPYITRTELKAVAEIIVSRFFSEKRVNAAMLCAMAEMSSGRLLYGWDPPNGIMQIAFPVVQRLYSDLGYKGYEAKLVDDLSRPFLSMYFAACYICYLSNFEGRSRSDQFIVESYMNDPQAANVRETGSYWLKYLDTLPLFEVKKRRQGGSCTVQ